MKYKATKRISAQLDDPFLRYRMHNITLQKYANFRAFRKNLTENEQINIFRFEFHQYSSNSSVYHMYENERDRRISLEHLRPWFTRRQLIGYKQNCLINEYIKYILGHLSYAN